MKFLKKIFQWSVEILIVGGLLYSEHYALAIVTAYLIFMTYRILRHVDFVRALVRVTNVFNETKLAALADGIPEETFDRAALRLEADEEGWESLKADAKKIGVTLQTVEETRRRREALAESPPRYSDGSAPD